jgi:hypothetical protein
MKQFIEFLIKNESWNENLMLDTQLKTGPLVMSVFFNKHLDDVLILDSDIFEPFGNVTKRTILNHKYDQSWTGYGTLPVTIYKFIKNNLVWILLFVVIIIKFLFFRKVLENSLG